MILGELFLVATILVQQPQTITARELVQQPEPVYPTSATITKLGVTETDDKGALFTCWFKDGNYTDCELAPSRTLSEALNKEYHRWVSYADAWQAEKQNSQSCIEQKDYIIKSYDKLEDNRQEIIKQYKAFIKDVQRQTQAIQKDLTRK